ncbi:hypothetical protein ACTFIZ_006726 [Dictyostelium cf. discoideum]
MELFINLTIHKECKSFSSRDLLAISNNQNKQYTINGTIDSPDIALLKEAAKYDESTISIVLPVFIQTNRIIQNELKKLTLIQLIPYKKAFIFFTQATHNNNSIDSIENQLTDGLLNMVIDHTTSNMHIITQQLKRVHNEILLIPDYNPIIARLINEMASWLSMVLLIDSGFLVVPSNFVKKQSVVSIW